MTLQPGDLITTGTPPGRRLGHEADAVFLKAGDDDAPGHRGPRRADPARCRGLRPLTPTLSPQARGEGGARAVLGLIPGGALRCGCCSPGRCGLGIDESYMVAAGRELRLGYFDHPPLILVAVGGRGAPLRQRGAGRRAAAVHRAVRALDLADVSARRRVVRRRAPALWAAIVLNLSPVFGVTTGGWVLPDGPLDCALLGAALCLCARCTSGCAAWRWWLAAGLAPGSRCCRNTPPALTVAGAFLYLLASRAHRRWLRRPEPYVAGAAGTGAVRAGAGVERDAWLGVLRVPGRPRGRGGCIRLAPLVVLAGEALFVLPWIWLPMMVVFVAALRAGPAELARWLLCCLGAPPIVVFALVGLWSQARAVPLGGARLPDAVPAARRGAGALAAQWPGGIRRTAWRPPRRSVLVLAVVAPRCASTGCRCRAPVRPAPTRRVDWTSLRTAWRRAACSTARIGSARWMARGRQDRLRARRRAGDVPERQRAAIRVRPAESAGGR